MAQVDPFGADAGFTPPPEDPGPPSGESDLLYPKYADIFNGSTGCTIDGAMASCDQVADMNPDSYTDLPPGISTIQIVIDRDTGDLGIRDTDFVINSETGDVYKRKWVDTSGTRPAPEQLPNGGVAVDDGDTIVTRGYIPSGHWEYTKVNFGSSKNPGSTQPQTNARNLLGDCAVHALLDTLSYSEGADYNTVVNGTVISAPNNPGLVGQRNVKVTDFSQHPNILVQVGPGLKSTAAGRYQFLNRTWNGLGLPSFNPFNQDIGAVMLMQRRGMITPLLNGDVQTAITNGNAEWASLPGSPYGQGTRSMNSLKNVYNRSFLNCVLQMHEIHQGQLDNSGA